MHRYLVMEDFRRSALSSNHSLYQCKLFLYTLEVQKEYSPGKTKRSWQDRHTRNASQNGSSINNQLYHDITADVGTFLPFHSSNTAENIAWSRAR
jgi:hypothetical protein